MDFGQVIESMFFYQTTTVHINRPGIPLLMQLADLEVLEELLKYHGLKIFYNNSIATVGIPGDGSYWVDTSSLANLDIEKELYEQAVIFNGDASKSKKFSKKLARLIGVHTLPSTVRNSIVQQLQDPEFLRISLDETLREHYPGITLPTADMRYELEFIANNRFRIHTNIIGSEENPFHDNSPILPLINATADLHLIADSSSEICLPEFSARILRQKIEGVMKKRVQSAENIASFQLAQFKEARAIREAVNTKKIHVKALLPVLRKADRFKGWLRDLSQDENLMNQYLEKIEEKTVLEGMGFKSMRFYFFTLLQTVLAAMAPVASLGINPVLGAIDAFLIDEMIKGWKPSQFVRGDLKKLLEG